MFSVINRLFLFSRAYCRVLYSSKCIFFKLWWELLVGLRLIQITWYPWHRSLWNYLLKVCNLIWWKKGLEIIFLEGWYKAHWLQNFCLCFRINQKMLSILIKMTIKCSCQFWIIILWVYGLFKVTTGIYYFDFVSFLN